MNPDLEVDVPDVRSRASAVDATGDRVASGVSAAPAPVLVPRWAAGDAAGLAADAARAQLAALGADAEAIARGMRAAAASYADTDLAVAARLRGLFGS